LLVEDEEELLLRLGGSLWMTEIGLRLEGEAVAPATPACSNGEGEEEVGVEKETEEEEGEEGEEELSREEAEIEEESEEEPIREEEEVGEMLASSRLLMGLGGFLGTGSPLPRITVLPPPK
jgi:hypothetical protein